MAVIGTLYIATLASTHDSLIRKVRLDELLYLEACGNYVKVFTETGMFLTKKSLADFESLSNQYPRANATNHESTTGRCARRGGHINIATVVVPRQANTPLATREEALF